MDISEFVGSVTGFEGLPHPEKIKHFVWYLHTQKGMERVNGAALKLCYDTVHSVAPDMSIYLPRLASKKPPELLRDKQGYRLEGSIRRALDAKYGAHPTTVAVTRILADLPGQIPDLAERAFIAEAMSCYKVGAFRATIVMAWNLAFDHLLRWVLADDARLSRFNAAIVKKYQKKAGVAIVSFDDFEDLKESETLEILRVSGLLTKDVLKILDEKLKKRNSAAHPSSVIITQHQADDTVTDLIHNVVLRLTA